MDGTTCFSICQCCGPISSLFRQRRQQDVFLTPEDVFLTPEAPAPAGPRAGPIESSAPEGANDPVIAHGPPRRWGCACRCSKRSRANAPSARSQEAVQQVHTETPGDDGCVSPTLGALDDRKRALVAEMRERVASLPADQRPPKRHDLWYKRYLAHSKWKVDKAMTLYKEFEDWRRRNRVDMFIQDVPDGRLPCLLGDIVQCIPWGHDRSGRPISLMNVATWPWWRQLFELHDDMINAQVWMFEWFDYLVARRARETGEWRERAVVLMDLSRLDRNYFMGMAGNSRVRQRSHLTGKVAALYPGLVDKAYIINAPSFAKTMWNAFKMALSKQLMDKATMIATDAEHAAMLEELGPDNVPRVLGGSSDGPDPSLLPEYLQMPPGGWGSVVNDWMPQKVDIAPGAVYEAGVDLPAGGRARWRWVVLDHSIEFAVSQRRDGGDWEQVAPRKEVAFKGADDPAIGEALAPEGGGRIQLLWDNRFSKFFGTTLLLRLEPVAFTDAN